MTKGLVWLRTDLRLDDNPALNAASDALMGVPSFGFPKISNSANFICLSVNVGAFGIV